MNICQHDDCENGVADYVYPDGKAAFFCTDHAAIAGFCIGCRGFYGGIESFHFHDPVGFCDDCKTDPDLFPQEDDRDWVEEALLGSDID